MRFHDSLSNNALTNYGEDMSGIVQLAEALKTNEGLTSLKYAPALPQICPIKQRQQPLTPRRDFPRNDFFSPLPLTLPIDSRLQCTVQPPRRRSNAAAKALLRGGRRGSSGPHTETLVNDAVFSIFREYIQSTWPTLSAIACAPHRTTPHVILYTCTHTNVVIS